MGIDSEAKSERKTLCCMYAVGGIMNQKILAYSENVYLNWVTTAVPNHDIHNKFVDFAPSLLKDASSRSIFKRMANRSQINHRYSFLELNVNSENDFYNLNMFPDTKTRMHFYENNAITLACQAIDQLDMLYYQKKISHLIITTCTGFYAPGLDVQIVKHYGLKPTIERSIIGFMGCNAAIPALKLARYIVSSCKDACVLIVNVELCTIHLQDTGTLEDILSFLIFADGCAASIVSADFHGIKLQSFHSTIIPDSLNQIAWNIGNKGFDMFLSGKVPHTIATVLPNYIDDITGGKTAKHFSYWAIHPGGRSILDAVEKGACLEKEFLKHSREVLRKFGNMSSATVMFVLKEIMQHEYKSGLGCAMSFGPGLTIESMLFEV